MNTKIVKCYKCLNEFHKDNNKKQSCRYHTGNIDFIGTKHVYTCCKKQIGSIECVRQIHFIDKKEEAQALIKGYLIVTLEEIKNNFKIDDSEIINNSILIDGEHSESNVGVYENNSLKRVIPVSDIIKEYEKSITSEEYRLFKVFESENDCYSDLYPDINEYNKFKKNEFFLLAPRSTIKFVYQ